MTTITDVLGRTRDKGHTYEDGSYSCPFCGAAVMPDDFSSRCAGWRGTFEGMHCHNPACAANPHLDPEPLKQRIAEQEARAKEAEEREARHKIHMEYLQRDKEQREEKWRLLATEANERGACLRCLRKSNWESGTPKFVKHRGTCPRER